MEPITIIQTIKESLTLKMVRKVLLIIGILSSLFYVGIDILAAMQWEGYSYTSQAFSELLAGGAPTRSFVLSLSTIYNVLVIAFGLCIWATDSRKRALRFTGILLIGYAIVGIVTPLFFPAPMRGAEATICNIMHLPFTGLEVLCILLSVGFGAAAHGKWFRLYSIGTILILILSGALAGSAVPQISAQQSTPFLGIIERIMIYGYLLWVMVLAIIHLRAENGQGSIE
ncbi:MAG TPA: DUF998 domain-containing protein [Clostridia bacterium]|nr:DUF998 domain-containing protein [Clostridia bacterium]